MITMEFEEMKKIWDSQNNEPLYAINETALHMAINRKKNKGLHITNVSELLSIVVNLGAGAVVLAADMAVLAGWMMIVGVYCLVGRIRRKMGEQQYDRTMLGDLDHAVSVANYQVRFSGLMRWNIFPIAGIILWSLWGKENSIELMIGMILFFAITFYATGWEHNYYKGRRRQLVGLREMLLSTKL
jgi:hypothetical protein